jgi:4'-phosphopantetheinyl transferase
MKLHFRDLSDVNREHKLPDTGTHHDEVHVWSHSIHFDDPFLREAPYLLSGEEMARAARYHFEKDKRVYEAGHVLIRKILSHYTNIDASKLDMTPIVNRKPELLNTPFRIHFNISHSGGKILVAVGFISDVGIDVEKIVPDFDMDGFADANYHANEVAKFRTLENNEETDYFYRIWTRKEAWLKLTGEGVNDKLRDLDFSGKEHKSSLPPHGHHDLYMTSWKEDPDYMATLAAYSDPKKYRFFVSDLLVSESII